MKPISVALLIASLICSTFAHAGNSGRGGGDEIFCNGGLLGLFLMHDRTLSDLNYNSGSGQLIPATILDDADEATVQESILKFLDQNQPALASDLRKAFANITFTPVGSVEKVKTGAPIDLSDRIFSGCFHKMLALQHFNTPTMGHSTVELVSDPVHKNREYDRYPRINQAFLKFHEAFIYLAQAHFKSITDMETEARARNVVLYNTPGLMRFMVADVLKMIRADPTQTPDRVLPWLDGVLRSSDDTASSYQQTVASVEDMITAGLDPNYAMNACNVPVLDYAIASEKDNCTTLIGKCDVTSFAPYVAATTLIKHGADVNVRQHDGRTPLQIAVLRDGDELIDALLDAHAELNATWCPPGSKAGRPAMTALDLARFFEKWQNYKYLLRKGAKSAKDLGAVCKDTPREAYVELSAKDAKACAHYRSQISGIAGI